MKCFLFLCIVAISVASCQKNIGVGTPSTPQVAEKIMLNVAYSTADTAQRMDVYLPANRSRATTKVLVMIHGGDFIEGDKTEFNEAVLALRPRLPDYAIFNLNYRLGVLPATNAFPTQENDIKAAVNFILSKADEYIFNKEKLALLGASAGAHLSLLQGYKYPTPKVNAVVDLFGPTDMAALYNTTPNPLLQFALQALLKGTPSTNAGLYQSSSPINFVTAQSPATLIFHGGLDPLVPIAQSTSLKAKLEAAGVSVKMVTYPAEGHGWTGTALTDTYGQIIQFLVDKNK